MNYVDTFLPQRKHTICNNEGPLMHKKKCYGFHSFERLWDSKESSSTCGFSRTVLIMGVCIYLGNHGEWRKAQKTVHLNTLANRHMSIGRCIHTYHDEDYTFWNKFERLIIIWCYLGIFGNQLNFTLLVSIVMPSIAICFHSDYISLNMTLRTVVYYSLFLFSFVSVSVCLPSINSPLVYCRLRCLCLPDISGTLFPCGLNRCG